MTDTLVDEIDRVLPQTQCELCEYKGCRPYAEAIVNEGQEIDRCLPGGVRVLKELGVLLQRDVQDMLSSMQLKQKKPTVVKVRESECIGCTKCIQACPVDAIVGASKHMHTVLADICNGCELCVPPCPVDCIDIISLPDRSDEEHYQLAEQSRVRFINRTTRFQRREQRELVQHQQAKLTVNQKTMASRQQAIKEALDRVKQKKGRKNES